MEKSEVMSKKNSGFLVTAWAERASGPGWANTLIYALYRDGNGQLTLECFQPDEQTAEMRILFDISASATTAMKQAVGRKMGKVKP